VIKQPAKLTMTTFRPPSRLATLFAAAMLVGWGHPSASRAALASEQRTIRSYAHGERVYTCLLIDGGALPLVVPNDAQVEAGDAVTVSWPGDGTTASFQTATPREAALCDLMGQPQAAAEWQNYAAAALQETHSTCTLRDFQPNILPVNHWQIGAISMDFTSGGVPYTCLLMLWRCRDGSTIAVKLNARSDIFDAKRDVVFGLIGSGMLMEK
jgi:hypothetical protein